MRTLGVALLLSILPFTANAQMEKPVPGKASVQTMNCTAMIKSKAPLTDKLAELMTQISESMDAHAKWLSGNRDKASKANVKELSRLAKDYNGLAKSLRKMSTEVDKVTLATVPHDMSKMDPKVTDTMSSQARLEREIAELFKRDAAATEKNVASIQPPKKASR